MSQTTARTRRVSELLQRELAELMRTELGDPRLAWVSVVAVEVAPDLRWARVFYSCMPDTEAAEQSEAVQDSLERASGYLRSRLGRKVSLRNIPRLTFVPDTSLEHADHINRLLHSLRPGENDGD